MNHNHTKHLLLMLACCLIPIALIAAVSIFGFSLGALQPLIPFVGALMCPLMMIVMTRGMMQGGGGDHSQYHANALRSVAMTQEAMSASNAPKATAPSAQEHCR